MNDSDTQFWADWKQFADAYEFRSFKAWAQNGSCIEQRMGIFDDVPQYWEALKPYAGELKDYEQANIAIVDPEYIKYSYLYQLRWTKNVRPSDGNYAYSQFKVSNLFKLAWKDDDENANRLEKNDLILLRQHGYVTHMVKVLDCQSEQEDWQHEYNIYRIVEVLWTIDCSNSPKFARADNIFGYLEVLDYRGGNVMKLEDLPTFQRRWNGEGGLSAFHKHLYKELPELK
jgi:hypothetical protein